jgi:hypothetical protein
VCQPLFLHRQEACAAVRVLLLLLLLLLLWHWGQSAA